MFDGNMATDGAAMNLISYGAIFYNVTFKSNRGSAVRVSYTTVGYTIIVSWFLFSEFLPLVYV